MHLASAAWRRVVADHVKLWEHLADRCSDLDSTSWDVVVCVLDQVNGTTVMAPAKQNAPFQIPQSPRDEDPRSHFDTFFDHRVRLAIPDFDAGAVEDASGELSDEEWDSLTDLHVGALTASLDDPAAKNALLRMAPRPFSVAWSPAADSDRYVHLRHVWGPELGHAVPPTTAYAALAPLYWHSHSYVGRYHTGLVFDGDLLVEAAFQGHDVTDDTLALLTPEAAKCCKTLRSLTFRDTRVSVAAVERVRRLLPETSVRLWS